MNVFETVILTQKVKFLCITNAKSNLRSLFQDGMQHASTNVLCYLVFLTTEWKGCLCETTDHNSYRSSQQAESISINT